MRFEIPKEVPVMPLPGIPFFPNTLLPLYMFEPRYRAMLAHCLERERMFCVTLVRPGVAEVGSVDDFFHVAGLGLVRACVGREDGTSHLILQGLTRVRFTGFLQEEPYYRATIEVIPSRDCDPKEIAPLGAALRQICAAYRAEGIELPPQVENCLETSADAEILGDLLACNLVGNTLHRQQLLEQAAVGDRLRMLIRCLGRDV